MKNQKLNKRRYLGSLCKHKHRYVYESTNSNVKRKTNLSVRYKGCNACCVCSAISVEKRKKQQKKYRDTHKKKMQKYQKNYCITHGKNYRSDYHHNYYLTVTKLKRKRERHNKKLLNGMNYP
jgi:hypothetical protein